MVVTMGDDVTMIFNFFLRFSRGRATEPGAEEGKIGFVSSLRARVEQLSREGPKDKLGSFRYLSGRRTAGEAETDYPIA
jgi:hypothetical protein